MVRPLVQWEKQNFDCSCVLPCAFMQHGLQKSGPIRIWSQIPISTPENVGQQKLFNGSPNPFGSTASRSDTNLRFVGVRLNSSNGNAFGTVRTSRWRYCPTIGFPNSIGDIFSVSIPPNFLISLDLQANIKFISISNCTERDEASLSKPRCARHFVVA
jgi:hypothetical protein